jgi:outer membrane protein assembly factor BamB
MALHTPWRSTVARCVVLAITSLTASAADWPQFLGPQRNATSTETGLARTWPATGPKQVWSTPLGAGFAGPSVSAGQVFILDRPDDTKDVLRCYDLADGKELWSFSYAAAGTFSFPGCRSTPTLTDKAAYIVGPLGHLHCVDRTSHQATWKKHLIDDFGGKLPTWAVSQSPLLYQDLVIVAPQSPTVGLAAFRKTTGELVWKSRPVGPLSYSSPLLARLCEVDQVLLVSGKGTVSGVAAADGRLLWQYLDWNCGIPIASPVLIGDGRVFISGEYGAGSVMLRIAVADGAFRAREILKTQECMSQIHQVLLYEDYLYANSNGNKVHDGFVCLDLDGKVKWRTGNEPNFERGSMLLADGMIFTVNGEDGTLAIFEASPKQFKLLASAPVLQGKQAWAPLALVDGKLLVRDQQQLKCFDVRAEAK